MRLFGFEITLRPLRIQKAQSLESLVGVPSSRWIWPWRIIHEPFTGAWQQNKVELDPNSTILSSSVVYACVTGIASDVAKLRIKLDQNTDGIWTEIVSGSPFLGVLRKPNHFQTRIQFLEQWIVSELLAGNTYVLKERDARGVVTRLYILDPLRVRPLVADDGSVFYQLSRDPLAQVTADSGIFDTDNPVVPASEIIHDRMCPLWHPLVGVPPIYAAAISATMANRIQSNATNLFANAARPGGILSTPTHIQDDTAARLKAAFEANFGGANVGRIAVLGDGLKFEPMVLTAEANQQIENLEWTVQDVARAFHYPVWKLGGPMPAYSSGPQALTLMYYTDCLQPLIEKVEVLLDEGLELPLEKNYGTELDIDNLLRMDTAALFEANNKAVGGGWMKPDEARFRANMSPVTGGNTPYLQQQNFSLAALAKRDAKEDPFASKAPTPPPAAPTPTPEPEQRGLTPEQITFFEVLLEAEIRKELVAP